MPPFTYSPFGDNPEQVYASLDAITYYRSVFMKAGIWLFNTTVQYHMRYVFCAKWTRTSNWI